jgi:YidC/Oxa1 family membrane protein insertase
MLFAMLVAFIFVANQVIYSLLFPPPPAPKEGAKGAAVAKAKPGKLAAGKPEQAGVKDHGAAQLEAAPEHPAEPAAEKPDKEAEKNPPVAADQQAPKDAAKEFAKPVDPKWGTLGSGDPDSPYRILVTWTNTGAAIERLELNSPRYHDLEDRSGYLGHLECTDAPGKAGALVRVVGPGTPADGAGLKPLDVITGVGDQKVTSADGLVDALKPTKPHQEVRISITRQGARQELKATLAWHPLQIMRPELDSKPLEVVQPKEHDPFSFLLTIQQYDERTLADDNGELGGVDLRNSEWEVVAANGDIVVFRKTLANLGLQVKKTYRLAKVPQDRLADPDYPAYSLQLDVSIANVGKQPHKVAYRLDGPTGLPIEGAWYAQKVSRNWGGAGVRDIVVHFDGGDTEQIACTTIADPDYKRPFRNSPLDFAAVDGIYFASAVIPQKEAPSDILFAEVKPIRVGELPADKANWKLTDVSFRLDSTTAELTPGGAALEHHLQIFAGPKRPTLLAQYAAQTVTLSELSYYGWFGVVARPMLMILHGFYYVVGNYGLAIIMLTVMVRGGMFPLGRRQAINAQKMQQLQPEIKRLQEKYKNDTEKKAKAQQDLFRQHNYNPLSGCLPMLLQFPIFVGLYRSLMVDVELRQAPLFGDSIRWASNLAAPDMFWDWTGVMPVFITQGNGFFALGPYLNILPLVTIALFIWQQKMFMPPPADEQAAMQQKMMKYMSIVVGIMFFKVASGLCIYLIASSIWGICERKLLPKAAAPGLAGAGKTSAAVTSPSAAGNGAAVSKKRQRGRR